MLIPAGCRAWQAGGGKSPPGGGYGRGRPVHRHSSSPLPSPLILVPRPPRPLTLRPASPPPQGRQDGGPQGRQEVPEVKRKSRARSLNEGLALPTSSSFSSSCLFVFASCPGPAIHTLRIPTHDPEPWRCIGASAIAVGGVCTSLSQGREPCVSWNVFLARDWGLRIVTYPHPGHHVSLATLLLSPLITRLSRSRRKMPKGAVDAAGRLAQGQRLLLHPAAGTSPASR